MLFIKRDQELGAYFHLLVMVGRWSSALRGMNGRRACSSPRCCPIVWLLTRKVASFGAARAAFLDRCVCACVRIRVSQTCGVMRKLCDGLTRVSVCRESTTRPNQVKRARERGGERERERERMEVIKAGGGGHDGGRQCGFHRRLLLSTIYTRSHYSIDNGDVTKMRERISA